MRSKKYKILQKLIITLWQEEDLLKIRFALGILLIFIASAVTLFLPWCLKLIVEKLSLASISTSLLLILLSYGLIWILSQALVVLRQIVLYRVFERVTHKLSMEVFEKLLKLPLAYHVNQSTGGLLNTIERAQTAVPDILFGLMLVVIPMIVEVIIALIFLGYLYESKYTMVLFTLFLAYFIFTWASIDWVVKAQRNGNKAHKNVSSYIADILMNIECLYYQDYHKQALYKCQKNMVVREDARTRQLVRVNTIHLGQIIIVGIGFIVITMLVGMDVANGRLVVSDFVLFNGYVIQFLMPLNAIGISVIRSIRDGLTRMEDMMDIIFTPDSITTIKTGQDTLPDSPVAIELKDISFKYPGTDCYVIQNISLCIAPGKTVALVGANGSGKSTIAKLLYRLYEPLSGDILLNQRDIKTFSLSSLRAHIGIVPQEPLLLNDTIYANIALNSGLAIDSGLFIQVMDEVGISDWVRGLPDGYNTTIGEGGAKLSGGAKQCIALARVLLRRPKIIIMDEATSAMDNRTESEIFANLKLSYNYISKLIITHNFQNLDFVDEIITLEPV